MLVRTVRRTTIVLALLGLASAFGQERGAPPPAGNQPASQPRLEIDATVFNFGEVWEGFPAQQEYTLKNAGTAPLVVRSTTTCGCTVASEIKSPLEPGESTKFTIKYDTKRVGAATKKVILHSNDPDRLTVDIPVRGIVKAVFKRTPGDQISFPELSTDSRQTAAITLENQYDRPVKLRLKDGQEFQKFEIAIKELEPGRRYELSATTKPPLDTGVNWANVIVATDLEAVPTLTFRVDASVPPRVTVTPPQLHVLPSMTKGGAEAIITVRCRTEPPLKVTGATATPESIKCQVEPAPTDQGARTSAYHVRVFLPAFDATPVEGGRIDIHFEDAAGEYKVYSVPVKKLVRPTTRPATSQPAGGRGKTPRP